MLIILSSEVPIGFRTSLSSLVGTGSNRQVVDLEEFIIEVNSDSSIGERLSKYTLGCAAISIWSKGGPI